MRHPTSDSYIIDDAAGKPSGEKVGEWAAIPSRLPCRMGDGTVPWPRRVPETPVFAIGANDFRNCGERYVWPLAALQGTRLSYALESRRIQNLTALPPRRNSATQAEDRGVATPPPSKGLPWRKCRQFTTFGSTFFTRRFAESTMKSTASRGEFVDFSSCSGFALRDFPAKISITHGRIEVISRRPSMFYRNKLLNPTMLNSSRQSDQQRFCADPEW
jgi:hypothetical protein